MSLPCLAVLVLAAPIPQAVQPASPTRQHAAQPVVRPRGHLLVSGYDSDAVHVYEAATGRFEQLVAPVPGAQSITTGPDGLVYVCAEKVDQVACIDPDTFELLAPFVFDDPMTAPDETGGLSGPTAAVFGPDGHLYVASFETDSVLRFDGVTGAFLDVFVGSGSGGLDGPDAGTTFGPDGHLYVPSFWNHAIHRYDGTTGAHLGAFVPSGGGGLRQPRDLEFRDGLWYVASSLNNRVLRYDAAGAFVDVFLISSQPYGLAFHPDDGHLYAVSLPLDNVRRFDGRTGALLGTTVPGGSGGLDGATYLHFVLP